MRSFSRNYKAVTVIVTLYLAVYTVLHQSGASLKLLGVMFILSPFLVVWMVYAILRHAPYNGRELREDEEWAYGDRDKKTNTL